MNARMSFTTPKHTTDRKRPDQIDSCGEHKSVTGRVPIDQTMINPEAVDISIDPLSGDVLADYSALSG